MGVINQYLQGLSLQICSAVWYACAGIFAVTVCALMVWFGFQGMQQKKAAILSGALAVGMFCIVIGVIFAIEGIVADGALLTGDAGFLIYLLCYPVILAKVLRCNILDAFDWAALSYLLGRGITVNACTFVGCCQGSPVPWGIFSHVYGTTVVPLALIKSVVMISLWLALHKYLKHMNYHANGKCGAICALVFGALVFCADIFSVGTTKIFYVTSLDGICALMTMIAGLVLLYIIDNKKTQESSVAAEACTN